MFTHDAIWRAIDGLAEDNALSPSALARRAGLDATSFNKSKRVNRQGRQRWPSTESIAKILVATKEPLEVFTRRIVDAADLRLDGVMPAASGGRRRKAPAAPDLHAAA